MPKYIRRLQISELSFVDEGANPGAHVLIAKRKEEPNMGDKIVTSDTSEKNDTELDTLRKRISELEKASPVIPEEITKHIEAQNVELKKLREEVEKARETAFVDVLKAKYDFAKEDGTAVAFYKLYKFDSELYASVLKVIDGVLAQVADSVVITKELGSSVATRTNSDASSVTQKAAAAAEELVKSGKAKTIGEALIQVYKTNTIIRKEVGE